MTDDIKEKWAYIVSCNEICQVEKKEFFDEAQDYSISNNLLCMPYKHH